MLDNKLENFFNPKSVALIGASSDNKKIGYEILNNILTAGYKGKIYPINLKRKKIMGLKAYPSVLAVLEKIDLAIIAIPATFVNSALEECGKAGIKNAIVISSGFKEIGGGGAKLEEKMKKIAQDFDMQILGPNCLGLADSFHNLNASFSRGMIKKGNLAFISQSGAIISAVLDWASINNVGFSKVISLGNKSVISEVELLKYLKNDESVSAVFAYLEDISNGKEFMKVAAEIVQKKPLFVIKPGFSKASKKAMQSHTGALSGDEKGTELAFLETGVTRVQNLGQMFDLIKFFSRYEMLSENRIAILTNAGGPGVIATDELEKNGLVLAKLEDNTKKKLSKNLPSEANIENPVDILGDARGDRYKSALEILGNDKNVDGILIVLTPQAGTEIKKTAQVISASSRNIKKPIGVSFIGGAEVSVGSDILNRSVVANYKGGISEAVFAFGKAYEYRKNSTVAGRFVKNYKGDNLKKEKRPKLKKLNFMESLHLIEEYGINVVPTSIAFSSEEAVAAAERMEYPLVLKIFSDTITHKTDVSGVKVGVENRTEVQNYFNEVSQKLDKNFQGLVLQPLLKGQEIILGVKRDEKFGHVIMFGLGGIYTEILKDVSFRLAPLNRREALNMIQEIKAFPVLNGYRSLPNVNLDKIVDALLGISNLVTDYPEIEELDINPIIADSKGYSAVDIRIVFEK